MGADGGHCNCTIDSIEVYEIEPEQVEFFENIIEDQDYRDMFLGAKFNWVWSRRFGIWWFALLYWPVTEGPLLRGVIGRMGAHLHRRIALRQDRWAWCYGV